MLLFEAMMQCDVIWSLLANICGVVFWFPAIKNAVNDTINDLVTTGSLEQVQFRGAFLKIL